MDDDIWITVGDADIHITRDDEGVGVDIWGTNQERHGEPLVNTWALNAELQGEA